MKGALVAAWTGVNGGGGGALETAPEAGRQLAGITVCPHLMQQGKPLTSADPHEKQRGTTTGWANEGV